MPRHNNRKHYPNEGKLGFNLEKYISKPGERPRHHSGYSPVQLAQRVSYEPRPAQNRHKARSLTKKKRRAMEEVRRMQQTAQRVRTTMKRPRYLQVDTPCTAPASSRPSMTTIQSAPVVTNLITSAQPISIIGGIKKWLKKTLLHE